MAILWMNLFIVFVASYTSRYLSSNMAINPPFIKPNKFLMFICSISLVTVSGLRNNIGDTYFYMHSYRIQNFSINSIDFKGDFGFNILQGILQSFSGDPQILIFTTALITNILIILVLYKYSRMIDLSLYVYITSGMYTVSMNGIRQYLAAAILFCATKFLLTGQFKKYLLVILFASTIHNSALVFIPIYFIVRREAWTKVTFLILALAVLIVLGFNEFSNFLFSTIKDTHYGQYSEFSEGGASVLRVIVNAVPVIIAFLGREKLKYMWPKSDYIVNLSVINLVFLIVSTQNWIFARFTIYFSLYNLILISWIVLLFKYNNRRFVYFSIIVCYLVFFYYEQVISLNIMYDSDFLKW
ncbi:EpsG family protein [Mesobacillus foraminis]|uniref:EpsG family protein n=1 Tax=Mesobacillus foraminis TaxID=279826 RepID=UPI000EF47E25|nr:EpsG family protein [Mesobacillus foraminis]